jgi:hypothetical protein
MMTDGERAQTEKDKVNAIVDRALAASFGEATNVLTVSFKKTVLIRDYETEVIEASTNVTLDHPVSGAERILITAIMRVQMEYEAYCNLVMKGMVTQMQFDMRKQALANDLLALKSKAESITGQNLDKYLELDFSN